MKIMTATDGKKTLSMTKSEWASIGNAFKKSQDLSVVKKLDHLDDRELTRGIRDAIIAELGAIKQYEVLADSTSEEKVKKVLQSIADEEKIHVGELQELLKMFDKEDPKFLDDGKEEVSGSK